MKLLGWMHQKLYQNSKELSMNFTGNPSCKYSTRTLIDKQLFNTEPTYTHSRQSYRNEMKETEKEEILEEPCDELFLGFLAIGTLGSESFNTDPPTPTFPSPFQNITNTEMEITVNEGKLINNELEKFLGAEAKEIGPESSARSSQVSVITFCNNNQLDNADSEDWRYSANCLLQKYLSAPETATAQMKQRMSLQELFRISDCGFENATKQYNCPGKPPKQRNAMHFMKKILKKLHSTAMTCTTASRAPCEKATKSVAIKKKHSKVMEIFHRKVYPEGLIAGNQFIEDKEEGIIKFSNKPNILYTEEGEKKRSSKEEICNLVPHPERIDNGGIAVSREHWIKTDDEYLVLEF